MIPDAILGLVLGFFEMCLDLSPEFTPPNIEFISTGSLGDGANDVGLALHAFDGWIDTELLATLLGFLVIVYGFILASRFIFWLYNRIPFKFT